MGSFLSSFVRMFVLALTLCADLASGQVRTFVSTSGSDGNPCTKALPCRNFDAAVAAVDSGGEVVALDSGGYGPVAINKSVAVIAAAGLHAAIAPTVGDAITIAAGTEDRVILRNLFLNNQGTAASGIVNQSAAEVSIQSCSISNFTSNGIYIVNTGDNSTVIKDSAIRASSYAIIMEFADAGTRVTVENSFLGLNFMGIEADSPGFVSVRDTVFSGNNFGVRAVGGQMGAVKSEINLESCLLNGNGVAVVSEGMGVQGSATVRLANTMIVNNDIGLEVLSGGAIVSFGNNMLHGNPVSALPTATILLQ